MLEGGKRFAASYPHAAAGLGIGEKGASDPHVERLLESFAFLTARLQMEVEDQNAGVSKSLLEVLYPDFTTSFPACTVLKTFGPPEGFSSERLPARTTMTTVSDEGAVCRFQTTADVDVLPLEVVDVSYVGSQSYTLSPDLLRSPWLLKITIESSATSLQELDLKKLRFYLGGDTLTAMTLFKWLHTYDAETVQPVLVQPIPGKNNLDPLPQDAFQRVGFEAEEGLLPSSPRVGAVYRLLWDFFQFPQKFMFFDVRGLGGVSFDQGQKKFSLLLPLGSAADPERWPLSAKDIALGCVPAINLFPKTSEPIYLDHKKSLYRLIPDYRLERFMEIHSISKISSASDPAAEAEEIEPYFDYAHSIEAKKDSLFWLQKRERTTMEDTKGTDLFLSFVDYNMDLKAAQNKTVYAHTLCMNRGLSEKIRVGTLFDVEGQSDDIRAKVIIPTSRPLYPETEGRMQWELIHHLSLDHLGLAASVHSAKPLKELLSLYNRGDPALGFAVEALRNVVFERRMGLIPGLAWKTLAPVLSVTLNVDEKRGNSQGLILLTMVLHELFKSRADFNCLVETNVLGSNSNVLRKWEAEACTGRMI